MSGNSDWNRQKQEVNSYNVFFSALTPRADPCLSALGFELPVVFPTIEDNRLDTIAEPDFLLYDGEICLLVEVKGGDNINDRHIDQMRACDDITIETVEKYLRQTDVAEKTSYSGNVRAVETAISYQGIDEEYIRKCQNEWEDCQEQLEELLNYTTVLAQGEGASLRQVAGRFGTPRLRGIFESGIDLPDNPKREFVLTENVEPESLAVAICRVVGEQAAKGPVRVTATDIRDQFAPRHAVRFAGIAHVIEFLEDIGACDINESDSEQQEEDGFDETLYEFNVNHMSEILDIEQTVSKKSIEEHFRDDDQSGLTEFTG